MNRIRNPEWENDESLAHDLEKYVFENLKREEILDFVKRDYPQYAWSLGTLSRRLRHFGVHYVDYCVTVEAVEEAVADENDGPGQLLGYRAMHKKIRERHQLAVPRGLVYDVMTEIDPEGLERRRTVGQRKKRKRDATGTFTSLGPNHTYSGDGHDKLMGFAKDTFPLAVYGMQDVFSSYILYLKVWVSNSNPKLVARWYLAHLYKVKVISCRLRLDKGTETGLMATTHAFLRNGVGGINNSEDVVQYGPSTSNKIERWWLELHTRLEKYFKRQLMMLLEQGHYNPNDPTDRHLLAFVFIPVLQKEMDIFQETVWNSHRVRRQKDAQLPKGVPNHLYGFPEKYGAEDCGYPVSEEALDEAAELSGALREGQDYLPPEVREACQRIIPEIDAVKARDAADTFLFLKTYYMQQSSQQ